MRRRSSTRTLAAVLFTDIVDSAVVASRVGDVRWKELISRHHTIVRRELRRFGGRELDTAGDGFFASFPEPATAIRCACAAAESVRQLGIEIRAGIHFGECEQVGGKLGGLTVVIGARVMALGGPGDVLVTGTTRELVAGAGFGFHERGAQSLKGVAGTWPVFAVSEVDGAPRTGPAEPDEAERRLAGVRPVAFRRRRGLAIVAGAVSLVGAAAVFALWAGVGGPPRLSGVPSDSVGRIDPETNAIEAALEVGSNPSGIAVDDGVAWVIRHEVGTIARLDDLESEGTDAGSTSTQGHPDAVGLDETGLVWVLNDLEGSVVRIDPRRVEIEGPPISLDIGTEDLAVGAGAVWVTNAVRRSLIRIDLVTNEVRERGIQGIGAPDGVAVGDGAIWVAGTKQVVKLDPTSMEKLGSWQLRSPGGDLAVGEGAVWVVQLAADQVIRIDQATGAPSSVDVGNAPLNVAIGGGAVWVTNTSDGTVSKIDADNPNDVEEIRVGGSPEGIAFGDGSVWVTVH